MADEVVRSSLQATEGGDVVLSAKPTGNTARVELFTTSATFSLPIKKEQQSLKFLLDSKKVRRYIDASLSFLNRYYRASLITICNKLIPG